MQGHSLCLKVAYVDCNIAFLEVKDTLFLVLRDGENIWRSAPCTAPQNWLYLQALLALAGIFRDQGQAMQAHGRLLPAAKCCSRLREDADMLYSTCVLKGLLTLQGLGFKVRV